VNTLMPLYFDSTAKTPDDIKLDDGSLITGTLVWFSAICERETWLMSKNITPDSEDESLQIGRAVHETTYNESKKEIEMDGIKIDIIREREHVVCEVKTSSRFLEPAKLQLLYYLYRLKIEGYDFEGKILIPREKKTIEVRLDDEEEQRVRDALIKIRRIANLETPPEARLIPFCRRCAYRYFCWSE
jgi:CRISPR-associated exonuclease Cas4